ncbi:MAG: binding-protein-dependent transport system inner rane component, partial [Paenibacillus sp.]|nr:binding-protein-dependent transport system inner rane component [Paenibacillus sp.]
MFRGVWASPWVGFKYYELFFQNRDFPILLRNTLLLGLYKLIFGFPAPLLLALAINAVKHAMLKRLVQTVSYLPYFISNVIVAGMIVLVLSPNGGAVNTLLDRLGLETINFLYLPEWFRTIYVASDVWQFAGYESILYLAALTAIDPQLYEAAE